MWPVRRSHGLRTLTTTTIFAAYALGVIAALLVFGRWSDEFGRRPLLLAGIAIASSGAVVFLTAGPIWQLMIACLLSGHWSSLSCSWSRPWRRSWAVRCRTRSRSSSAVPCWPLAGWS
ncbi:MFS transporter [Nocardia bhagyanarayanae]|uniref:MFS transporter n=1 Tax=Nocardia bhagyanarayanae TaxID=1215925 RepID=UPI00319E1523